MKAFLLKIWTAIKSFFGKFNWKLKLAFKGIEGDNTKNDTIWLLIPTIYGRHIDKETEIGFMWFGIGFKLVVSKKEVLPPV